MIDNVADVAAVAHVGTHGPDANNVISRGYAAASVITQGDVETAGCIGTEGLKTVGCVVLPVVLLPSAPTPLAVFLDPLEVVMERSLTNGRVVGSGCVVVERRNTVGRVPRASCCKRAPRNR